MKTLSKAFLCLTAFSAILSLCSSCSVREDRDDCPSYLTVDLRENGHENADIRVFSPDGNLIVMDKITPGVTHEEESFLQYRYRVPKGKNALSVFSGIKTLIPSGNALLLSPLSQIDSLYGSFTLCPSFNEITSVAPKMHKQFATIDLILALEDDDRDKGTSLPSGLSVKVDIGVIGISSMGFSPINGNTSFSVPFNSESGSYRFRLPRMGEEKIIASIISSSGETVSTIDIGKILSEAGYNWDDEDLSDATIIADKTGGRFFAEISSWGKRIIEIILAHLQTSVGGLSEEPA